MRLSLTILIVIAFLNSCSTTKKLVYLDEWEGQYILKRFDCCGNLPTKVMLSVKRLGINRYEWKMFGFESLANDTLAGQAEYERKKLNFFVTNIEVAGKHFEEVLRTNRPVFRMEYDNYSSDGAKLYVDYFTRFNNELVKYRSQNKLFAGVHYHFKSEDIKQ